MSHTPSRMNGISLLPALVAAYLMAALGCGSGSSWGRAAQTDSIEAHARDAALGSAATCLGRHELRSQDVLTQCEHAGKDSSVRVHIEWATANAWGARASKEGMPGDCVYVAGWPTESQYLLTSVEHRGAPLGGSTCDGDTTLAARSWPEFVQASLALVLKRELRMIHNYQTAHTGAFPPADSIHLRSDSLIQYRPLWARPDGVAIEASSPLLRGVSCVIWDGALNGRTPPTTAGHRAARAGVAMCDDFRSARRVRS